MAQPGQVNAGTFSASSRSRHSRQGRLAVAALALAGLAAALGPGTAAALPPAYAITFSPPAPLSVMEGDSLVIDVDLGFVSCSSFPTVTWNAQLFPAADPNPAEGDEWTTLIPSNLSWSAFPSPTVQFTIQTAVDADSDNDVAKLALTHFSDGIIDCGGGNTHPPPATTVFVNFVIMEPPQPTFKITGGGQEIDEGDSSTAAVSLQIELTNAPPPPWTAEVHYGTQNGTATSADNDYDPVSPPLSVFLSDTDNPKTITVEIVGDTVPEPDETFKVKLGGPSDYPIDAGASEAEIVIKNDDVVPTITIGDINATEQDPPANTFAQLEVTINPPQSVPVQVDFHTDNLGATPNPATPNVDYISLTGSETIPPNTSSITIGVQVIGDAQAEPVETFFVYIDSVSITATITDSRGDVTINDDDGPVPHLSITDEGHAEGDLGGTNAIFFNVNRTDIAGATGERGGPITVEYQTADGSATQPGDYEQTSGTLSFGPSEFTKQIQVNVTGDNTAEGEEEFTIKLLNATGAVIDDGEAIGTIHDDDASALPTLSVAPASRLEGNSGQSQLAFTVTLSAASPTPVTFFYATDDNGTADAGSDFVAVPPTAVNIPANQTSTTVQVPILGDSAVEPDETFDVVLSSPTNALLGDARSTGTIANDDAPAGSLSVNDVSYDERDADQGVSLFFTVTLSTALPGTVTVQYATEDDTAASGSDYAATSGQLSFAHGQTSKQVAVTVSGDAVPEPNETFRLRLSAPTGGATIGDDAGLATLVNDDGVTLSVDDVTVTEGNGGLENAAQAVFTVTLAPPQPVQVTVDYATVAGSAAASSDFQARSGTLTFAPGETTKTVSVPVVGDVTDEPDETFELQLANATGGGTITDASGVGKIVDDDAAAPIPNLTVDDASVAEGNQGFQVLSFEARLDRPAANTVRVQAQTADGSATTADNDYVALAGREISFPPGTTTQQVQVQVVGDLRVESNEQLSLRLSNAQGATLIRSQATGTLVNDDQESGPTSTIRLLSAEPVGENDGPGLIVLERFGDPRGAARVLLVAEPGTASAGDDFTPLRQVVEWGAGVGGQVEVALPIVNDSLLEGEETVAIFLSEAQGALLGQPDSGQLSILDDDTPMRLEPITAAEQEAQVGQTLELALRVVREDGRPVIGALVGFEAVSGPVRFTDENPAVRSGEGGVALRKIVVGPVPGTARVRAFLGETAEAIFEIRVRGNLADPGAGTGRPGVGGTLNESCADATGALAEACAYIFNLTPGAEQRQALDELTPRGVVAQVRAALQAPVNQHRNIGQRMDALRGGAPLQAFDQLSFAIQGQGLGMAPLQQAFGKGAKASVAPERQLADRVELALAKAQGRAAPRSAQAASEAAVTGSGESRWGMFVNGRMSFGDAPRRGEDPSYDFETQGLTAGVDYRISDALVVGGALGWLKTDSTLDVDGGSIDTEGYSLNLYGTWYSERFYVEAVVGYGRNDYEFTRVIVLPRPFQGRTELLAVGTPDSRQLSADLGIGYELRAGQALSLTAIGRIGWIDTTIDPYAESGAGAFNLSFAEQSLDSLLAEAGLEMTYPWSVSWGVLQPMVRLSYLHEFEDDAAVIRARFTADGGQRFFVVQAQNPDRNYMNLAAGISATLPRGWATFLQYDTDLQREELDLYTLTGGIRFQF